jgi:hypothetical protein
MYTDKPEMWMFTCLKWLAELPFEEKTFLHWWTSVNATKPLGGSSNFTGVFFIPPYFEKREFRALLVEKDNVDFLCSIPITDKEMAYKQQYGGYALEDLMKKAELDPILDMQRKSLVD